MGKRWARERARLGHRLVPLAGALLVVAACAKVAGIDALEIGECKGGGSCLEESPGDGGPSPEREAGPPVEAGAPDANGACPGTSGPEMVRVGAPANTFCIDATEVTVKQYRDFTTAKGADVSGQPAQCTWNTTYAAAVGGTDDLPIAGVDWCDARAYCAWAGKRLCGKHAGGVFTGPVPIADVGDFTSNEWLLACSNLGQLRYPYGGIQQPLACNTAENDAGRTLAVESKPGCQGGFPGVHDMVGNVWEWFDGPCVKPDAGADAAAADAGPAKDECFVKGGSFLNAGAAVDCRVDGRGASRDRRGQDIGFRCCSD